MVYQECCKETDLNNDIYFALVQTDNYFLILFCWTSSPKYYCIQFCNANPYIGRVGTGNYLAIFFFLNQLSSGVVFLCLKSNYCFLLLLKGNQKGIWGNMWISIFPLSSCRGVSVSVLRLRTKPASNQTKVTFAISLQTDISQ